jgi:hypothetical protein
MWRGPSMAVPPRNISRAWRVALNCRLFRPGVVVKPTGPEGPADAVVSDVLQQSQRQPCADCPTGRVRLGRPPLRSRTTSSKSSTQIPVQPPAGCGGGCRRAPADPQPPAAPGDLADPHAPVPTPWWWPTPWSRRSRCHCRTCSGPVIDVLAVSARSRWSARSSRPPVSGLHGVAPSPRHTWSRPARTAACGAVLRSVGLAVPRPGSARWDIPLHHDTEIGRIPAVCRLTGGGGGTGGEPSLSPIVDQPPSAPPCPGLPMEETPATSIILSCQLNGCCDPVPALKQEPERAAAKWRAAFRSGSRAHDLRRVGSGQCASK